LKGFLVGGVQEWTLPRTHRQIQDL